MFDDDYNEEAPRKLSEDMVDITELSSPTEDALKALIALNPDTRVKRDFDEGMLEFTNLCYVTSAIASSFEILSEESPFSSLFKDNPELQDALGDFLTDSVTSEMMERDMQVHQELHWLINAHLSKRRSEIMDKFGK